MATKGLRSKRCNVSERVNNLSDLPDHVLSHILSLLPTTAEAVKTSILSKRWKNLWTNVHTLVFKANQYHNQYDHPRPRPRPRPQPRNMQFSQFVNRVLQCHRGSIKTMKLAHVFTLLNDFDVRNWINFAIDRGVEILELNGFHVEGMNFRWPFCMFRSQTLVRLRLVGIDITDLKFPSAPFFPALKTLEIRTVDIYPECIEPLQYLISGCSVLECLNIDMIVMHGDSLIVSSSMLKRLVIDYLYDPVDLGANFRPRFVLEVPALEFLRVHGPPAGLVVKGQLSSSLDEVDIYVHRGVTDEDEDIGSIARFMEHISNVKSLQLVSSFNKPLAYAMNTKFPNLTNLKITSSCFEWPILLSFMESSIKLECITLYKFHGELEKHEDWVDPPKVPQCLLSSLRKISIKGYRIENMLNMMDYVLRNAEIMERMDIGELQFIGIGNYKARCKLLLKLLMMKRASRGCQISFV